MCTANNGECIVTVNGYYTEVGLCIAIGLVWYIVFKKPIVNLQRSNLSDWLVKSRRSADTGKTTNATIRV